MRISNEYVEVKIGNKIFRKHNFFFNNYLTSLRFRQLKLAFPKVGYANTDANIELTCCYLKLDSPLSKEPDKGNAPNYNEFDVMLMLKNDIQSTTNDSVSVIYTYDNQLFKVRKGDKFDDTISANRSIFNNRKIYAIAFGNADNSNIYSYLDTSNYNLILDDNLFMIERRDTIYTDSVVVGYPYPYHLAVKQDIIKVNGEDKKIYAQLYSVCFGEKTGVIYEEYPINEIENIEEAKAFHFELSNTKRQGIYPSTQLYPMDNLYPLMPDLNYIIFKYKLCYNNSDSTTSPEMIDIGKEYKVVFPCSKKDKLRISAYYDN